MFQSTLPRRERHKTVGVIPLNLGFNPRSHEGSDDYNTVLRRVVKVSIHAPTKGATIFTAAYYTDPRFQSTLPRRERPSGFAPERCAPWVSIHAPTKGATEWHAGESTA